MTNTSPISVNYTNANTISNGTNLGHSKPLPLIELQNINNKIILEQKDNIKIIEDYFATNYNSQILVRPSYNDYKKIIKKMPNCWWKINNKEVYIISHNTLYRFQINQPDALSLIDQNKIYDIFMSNVKHAYKQGNDLIYNYYIIEHHYNNYIKLNNHKSEEQLNNEILKFNALYDRYKELHMIEKILMEKLTMNNLVNCANDVAFIALPIGKTIKIKISSIKFKKLKN